MARKLSLSCGKPKELTSLIKTSAVRSHSLHRPLIIDKRRVLQDIEDKRNVDSCVL